jgi:2-oxoglutarate ferredoxin oxidoreductase subunit alpha
MVVSTEPANTRKKPLPVIEREELTVRFAGDSGDGMQLVGMQMTNTAAMFGNDVSTFPDFPAEIRAPAGTLAGVSGYQLNFGQHKLRTAGDRATPIARTHARSHAADSRRGISCHEDPLTKNNLAVAMMRRSADDGSLTTNSFSAF